MGAPNKLPGVKGWSIVVLLIICGMNVVENAVIALPADLIFGARIRSVAEAAGLNVMLAKDVADLMAKIGEHKARLAILDLDRRGLNVHDAVTSIKQSGVPLLCYVSHVREDLIAEAKEAGADRVIARGAFSRNMEQLLRE